MNRILLIFGVLLLIYSCKSTRTEHKSKTLKEFVNLYAFIGEKISLTEFDPNKNNTKMEVDSITGDTILYHNISIDYAFKAKYKVLEKVYNKFKSDTIEFLVYDHYGRPKFENYEVVILYLSKDKNTNEYYHQKYQFDPITIDLDNGDWIGFEGESIKELFERKKNGVLKARGIFD
ncbi:hypothetical protein [Tenacibaculum sp. 190524A05c]|uniref:hypothetical protein n=1 Tax=Tenacibaculum platacis TaxID=3137852 RepID=UPI0032B211CC